MKLIFPIFLILLLSSFFKKEESDKFDWIIGNWSSLSEKGIFYENWVKIDDLNYKGFEYQVYECDTLFKANLKIQKIDNNWVYTAQVNNSNPVLFSLKESKDFYQFENKEHDFPQTIKYLIINKNNIKVIVEGKIKGEFYKEEIDLKKKMTHL